MRRLCRAYIIYLLMLWRRDSYLLLVAKLEYHHRVDVRNGSRHRYATLLGSFGSGFFSSPFYSFVDIFGISAGIRDCSWLASSRKRIPVKMGMGLKLASHWGILLGDENQQVRQKRAVGWHGALMAPAGPSYSDDIGCTRRDARLLLAARSLQIFSACSNRPAVRAARNDGNHHVAHQLDNQLVADGGRRARAH